ncbi:MAG: hypothetical protein ACLPX9_15830 [Rhodomicrobium sp.]
MTRTIFVSIWILSVTLASAYMGATLQLRSTAHSSEPVDDGPALITLKSMTVPVIANGEMQGYVLADMTLSLKRDLLKTMPQPPDLVVSDAVFKTVYAEEQVDFRHLKKQDLGKLSKSIAESVNAKAGVPVVENVLIQELHYLSKQEAGIASGPSQH